MIRLAKTAGFCFGVDRAVKLCEELLDSGKKVATLGPIIHNDDVVSGLAARGCVIVNEPEETPDGAVLVIRSHGVPQSVMDRCAALGLEVKDATCPFVSKIHRIVREQGDLGRTVIIAGNPDHHEVLGIVGHCSGRCFVAETMEELQALPIGRDEPVSMVAQTTFSLGKYADFEGCGP